MATSVMINDGRTQRTKDFYNKQNIFMGIGRTTVWTSEPTPDNASEIQEEIEELLVIQRIGTKKYVRSQTGGEITFNGLEWTEIDPNEISLVGTDIAFLNATSEITSSSTDFSQYKAGDKIKVIGSTSNDGQYDIVTAGANSLILQQAVVEEAAGASIEVKSNIFIQDCHNIFYEANLDYDNGNPDSLPVDVQFRQVGLLEDPIDSSEAVCSLTTYLPGSLSATAEYPQGKLHYIDNRPPIYRTLTQRETIALVIEF